MGEEIWTIMQNYRGLFEKEKEIFHKRIASKYDIIHQETEFKIDKHGNWILQCIYLIQLYKGQRRRQLSSYCWIEFNSSSAILYGITKGKTNKQLDYVLFRTIDEVEEYYRVLKYDMEVNNYGMRKEAQQNYEKNK